MGGYRAVAAAVSGDSSKSSAESSFRELDDVFLQTQTRIWLGEVLKMRFDEHLHISDLLADGDLLFEVSKVLWNMLLAKCGELRHLKYEPLSSRRCSGRYMPYSNVDSFLKICKILGLNGIDLFSPSDVVEKKNIRKVCICIRALSNKARSKQLKVPDFDLVTYTVVMPKDMVGGIRRSLETSSSLSSSSGYYSYKEPRSKHMERNKTRESEGNYDSLSEESDEAESKFVGEESCCSFMNQLEDDNTTDSDADNSIDEHSAVRKNGREKIGVLSCSHGHHVYKCDFCKYGSKLSKTLPSQCARNDRTEDSCSSICTNSQSRSLTSRGNGGKYSTANDSIHFDYRDLNVVNDESVVGDSMFDNEVESSYISNYLAFSDSVIGGTDGSTPVPRKGEDNILNLFMDIDSHEPNLSERTSQNGLQNKFSDTEDAEVSSTTSMSSVLCRVRALDFDDQFDADDCLTAETPCALLENDADRQYKYASAGHNALNVATNELMFHDTKEPSIVKPKISASLSELTYSCPDELQPLTDKIVSSHGNSSNYFDEELEAARSKDKFVDTACRNNLKNVSLVNTSEGCDGDSQYLKFVSDEVSSTCEPSMTLDGVNMDQNSVISANCCEHIEKEHSCPCSSVYDLGDASEVCEPTVPGDDDDTKHKVSYVLEENASQRRQETDSGQLNDKHRQRPLLKTVARGTALVGVLCLLLHFSRRRNKQESSEAGSRPTQSKKFRGRDFSYGDGQNGRRVDRVYPSEKLKFKN
ncbi:uncharacterized protein LOC107776351 isoform X1 [Nicotiana tabacum]|uniref:Uncharacterized protein LOC107776351 isoform X1 n=2 Tax=Nicotiana TaxID=4085 RepID=A0A1S3YHY0_TOBAC|nr:PREDICTED: uncharacterized protein LOC104210636 [Nicotiana sylvestris]XP_016451725.1 PREDICTED: uncharacterized protein LOC107776351 isoform X1 [Nicotiana tabacum]